MSSLNSEDLPGRSSRTVKLNQLCRHGFCRIDLFLVEDEIIVPLQLVTVDNLDLETLSPSSQKSL
jgi:hypothetical protein